VTLRRALSRRETAQLIEIVAPLLPDIDLALVDMDGRLFSGKGEWQAQELTHAIDRLGTDQVVQVDDVLVFSLRIDSDILGALVVRGSGLADPHQEQVVHAFRRGLTLFATQSMEKRAVARETLERYREINLLYKVGETITSCLDAQVLPGRVMEESSRIIRNDAVVVFLVDPDSGALEIQAAKNIASGEIPARLAHDAARRVVVQGESHIDNDLPRKEETGWVHALVGVPFKYRDYASGAIVLLRGEEKGMFTAGEEKLLTALATQTAIALENARLYSLVGRALERREGQLSTVEEIARELNATLNLKHVLGLVVQRCLEATEAQCGAIVLLRVNGALQTFSSFGFGDGLPFHLQRLAERVIETGESVVIRGEHLVAPIQLGESALGAIVLAESAGGFSDEDAAFIGHLTAQAATAIHNARLYENAEQERSKLAAILEGTREAVVVIDEEYRVALLNVSSQTFFEVPTEEVVGRALADVTAAPDLMMLLDRCEREEQPIIGEVSGPGGKAFYAGVSPVSGIGWVVVMQDITYLKELDDLRNEFVAAASHDLKNPIGVIMGYASMMPHQGSLTEEQQESLSQIIRSSQGMADLINDLLDIVRIEAGFLGQVRACDMGAIVKDAVGQLRYQARARRIRLRDRISRRASSVQGNPHRLAQVVTNLVGNAIKYTPEGGRVTVSVRTNDGHVIVEVNDTGIGIEPADLGHVFDRFYRAREVTEQGIEGTGLGLAICKSIVEKHNGQIWAESKKGRGSTFSFSLPVTE
jgi:signal transduction histidine kinase